ncbi:BTAD domain-containing putative transcriptional regulator [Streptomyces sp. NPDC058279]|uniref:AfsR/SARP family transcriptional regulator n=1 Tax=Streptomyces sp. NPDC058279 TaxID=3346418 RepID=UPI0036E558BF
MWAGDAAADAPDGDDAPLFRLLGPVRVGLPGGPAARPGPPRRQAVLSVLLLRRRRPVPVAELVAAVWGDDAPASAAGNVRTHAWALRTLLEPGRTPREPSRILLGDERGYALHTPDDSVDVRRFEQRVEAARTARGRGDTAAEHALLAEALSLWSGEALAGVPGPFAEAERVRLAALCTAARKRHTACALRLGLHHTVVPALTALTREFPLDEELRALLMRALHGCGRQAEAFTVFADTHRVLGEELGVAPCRELTALHARLLTREPPPAVRHLPHTPATGRPPVPGAAPADAADRAFVEARGVLTGGADRAPVPVLVLAGPAGAGKTALAGRLADSTVDRFPDGRFSAELRTWGPDPAGAGALLAHLLHAFGIPAARVPADPDQRAALYRSALAVRRVLLVLHGARDAAQVMPLLPGSPGSAVLVTTRSRVLASALPSATSVRLTGRPPAMVQPATVPPGGPDTGTPDWTDLRPDLARAARRLARTAAGTAAGIGPSSADALAPVLGTGLTDAALIAEALVDAGVLDTPVPGSYRPVNPS